MDNGEQYVMMVGVSMTLELHVVNLDIQMRLERFKVLRYLMEQDRYGWMTSHALAVNKPWPVVLIGDGEVITAAIMKTPELNAYLQVSFLFVHNMQGYIIVVSPALGKMTKFKACFLAL